MPHCQTEAAKPCLHGGAQLSAAAIADAVAPRCLPRLLLPQACQSSLNTAGLALIMQTVATGLLVTASIANEDYSGALGDGIQVRRTFSELN